MCAFPYHIILRISGDAITGPNDIFLEENPEDIKASKQLVRKRFFLAIFLYNGATYMRVHLLLFVHGKTQMRN